MTAFIAEVNRGVFAAAESPVSRSISVTELFPLRLVEGAKRDVPRHSRCRWEGTRLRHRSTLCSSKSLVGCLYERCRRERPQAQRSMRRFFLPSVSARSPVGEAPQTRPAFRRPTRGATECRKQILRGVEPRGQRSLSALRISKMCSCLPRILRTIPFVTGILEFLASTANREGTLRGGY